MKLRFFALFAVLAATAFFATLASACPFCAENRGPTLSGEFDFAHIVLYGTLENPKVTDVNFNEGTTDLKITSVLKVDDAGKEYLKNKTSVTLPKYVNQPGKKLVVYCDIYKGKLDPYRGMEVGADSALVTYLQGLLKLQGQPLEKRLRFCFDHLNGADSDVSLDAYREFARADYKDYAELAKKLPPDTIAGWLNDPKTPPYRYGLYGSLLGLCGKDEHAKLLRSMIDDAEKYKSSGIDGLLAGYVMLRPKEALGFLRDTLADSKSDFQKRYPVLRTLRFFYDQRPDVLDRKDILGSLSMILQQGDMADFVIEDFRKWKRWEMTGQILDLYEQKSHDTRSVKRAILRYALRSPEPRAVQFIQEQRRRLGEYIDELEENLQLDDPVPAKK